LLWQLKSSLDEARIDFLLEQEEKTGISSSFLSVPEIFPHLMLVWSIFQLVRHSRPLGFGMLWYVPLSEMVHALNLFSIFDLDLRMYYIVLLQRLDVAYVQYWSEQNQQEAKLQNANMPQSAKVRRI
jgi:hypothetical protein